MLAAYPGPPAGIEVLWEHIQVERQDISVSNERRKLIRSMPDRTQPAIKALEEGYTKY